MTSATEVLEFWKSIGPEGWWKKNDEVDDKISKTFGELHKKATNGLLESWHREPDACLAHVIILDQFSRNMFRGDPKTFAFDPQALLIAREAIGKGFDSKCDKDLYSFFYLPFMHSEAIRDQQESVLLMHHHGGAESLSAALEHRDIIQRFGRFPHRNSVLGRHTTPAERAFLDAGGFKG